MVLERVLFQIFGMQTIFPFPAAIKPDHQERVELLVIKSFAPERINNVSQAVDSFGVIISKSRRVVRVSISSLLPSVQITVFRSLPRRAICDSRLITPISESIKSESRT